MASLNLDILEEIVPQFNVLLMDVNESLDAIEKFMRSGKEPYEAALRYFSCVDLVTVESFNLRLDIKRMAVPNSYGKKTNLYKFPFDHPLLDDILKAVAKSNKKLEIENYPMTVAGIQLLPMLIHKDLKFLGFDSGKVFPADYYKFFKDECRFDDAQLIVCCSKNSTIPEFFELTSAHHCVKTHLENFLLNMPEGDTYPTVKSLRFDPCPCDQCFDDFIFNTETINELLTFVSSSMPNLAKLDTEFVLNLHPRFYSWEEVYREMKKFRSNKLLQLPPHVNGVLLFCVNDLSERFKNAMKKIGENPEIDIDVDVNKKRLIKKFDIHQGLRFEFVLQFNDEDSEWEEGSFLDGIESDDDWADEEEEEDFSDY